MKKGFTLTELMIAIAVLSILAAIALPQLNGMRVRSRDVKRITDLKNLQVALERYFDKHGQYPNTAGAVAVSGVPSECTPSAGRVNFLDTDLALLVEEGFIDYLPKDPINRIVGGTGYCYSYYPNYSCGSNERNVATYRLYFYPEDIDVFGGPGGGEHSTKRYQSSNHILCLDPL